MNKYNIDFFYMHLFTMRSQCVLNRSSNQDAHYSCPQDKNTSLKLPVGVSPLQLVNLHRNRRYFVIKLHTNVLKTHTILLHLSTPYLFLDTAA